MGFEVTAAVYFRFMGRFSEPLAARFAAALDIPAGTRALDVGCGPGALTAQLVARLGVDAVSAVDPSESFVVAARERFPGLRVMTGVAEALPLPDDSVDLAVAQLVVHFLPDPVAGLAEMARVTRPGGVVAANVWDHAGNGGPLDAFWRAAHDLDPAAPGEAARPGTREGQLAELLGAAGLRDVESWSESVGARYESVDEWWATFTLGVGPAGAYVASLGDPEREALRARCAELLPAAPFEIPAVAWCARGRA
ncbi:class I SAM-dependent methyltransferase [Cellulomonas xylanilytica]|uniref:Methyltransferase n=1 Tax=Cellulomonas xylanilytica TaxID=233583 RepID=A0A510V371_9CELL|nr:methyltransferase domain-containing protein [Cellulomonas xylanilytica]GEK19575.1 methyltransferase [Cellulomonas xylanilytica]